MSAVLSVSSVLTDAPAMLPDMGRLLARLCDPNDRVASCAFAEAVFPWLLEQLQRDHPHMEEHLLREAASETVIGLIRNPHSFDPGRATLTAYLRMSGNGDLKNALEREGRHRTNLRVYVELDELGRNDSSEEGLRWEDYPELQAVRDGLDATDRAVLDLMRQGARHTEFAAALAVTDLPLEEQQRKVKQAKDRILKRLIRAGGKL